MIAIGVFWFLYSGKLGEMHIDKALFWSLLAIWGWFSAEMVMDTEKYKTPMFVADGIHGSNYTMTVKTGLFSIYRLGDIKFLGIEGKEGTVVVPSKMDFTLGHNKVNFCRVDKVSISQVPPNVRKEIVRHNMNTENIYYGICPLKYEIENPNIVVQQILDRDNNELISRKDNLLDRNREDVIREVNYATSISGTQKTFLDTLRNMFRREPREPEQ